MQNDDGIQKINRMQKFWGPILAGLGSGVFLGVGLGFLVVATFATPAVVLPVFFTTLLLCATVGALAGLIGSLISLSHSDPVDSTTEGLSSADKPSSGQSPLAGLGHSVTPATRNESAPDNFPGIFTAPEKITPPAEPGSAPDPK